MSALTHRRTASAWHDGQWSPLYAYASTGTVVRGLDDEIRQCLDVVERGDLDLELDPVVEHGRLLALLHEVEPEIAKAKAREIGADDGETAAAWWQQDTLGGRATGNTAAVAGRVLAGIEDGDPAVLDTLTTPIAGFKPEDLERDCDWEEPDLDDRAAHARWEAARPGLWDAYQGAFGESFHEAVVAACRRELADTGISTSPHATTVAVPARRVHVTDGHRAQARWQGADAAAVEASGLLLTHSEAEAVVAERHHIDAPALTRQWGGHPTPGALASEILGRRLSDERPGDAEAITAIAREWEIGRDIVWDAALRANALRTLGHSKDERSIEQVYEGRIRMLAGAARSPVEARSAEPYVRPVAFVGLRPDTRTRATPAGWVVEPIGVWDGVAHEVLYDPRRYEVAVTDSPVDTGPTAGPGWELRATDGQRGFWTLDRVVAASAWLDRFEQLAMATESRQPATSVTNPVPVRELGL